MPIDSASLSKLVQSAIKRYAPNGTELNALEISKIYEALNPGGVLANMIADINARSAGPPANKAAGAHAIFYSGLLTQGPAYQLVAKVTQKSGGTMYSIDETDAGQYINDPTKYQPAYTWFLDNTGGLSAPLQSAIQQIVGGAASYNYAYSAPSISEVILGTNPDPNSVLFSVEIPTFAAQHPSGTWNGVLVSGLAGSNYQPTDIGNPRPEHVSTKNALLTSMAHWNVLESDGTYVTSNMYSPVTNSQSGNTLLVTTSNNGLNVSKDAIVQLSGNYNSVSSQSNATITLATGSLGDDVSMSSGHLNVQNYAGGWGADALKLVGSSNSVTTGIADILLVQGNGNNITAGDSSYVGVLTGSNSTTINMAHGTIYASAGIELNIFGDNLLIQVSDMHDWPKLHVGITTKFTILEVAPDNTRQEVTVFASSAVANFKRQSVSYLADGRKFAEGIHAWDNSFAIKYFNYANTNVGSGWGDTYIIFDTNGKAIQQVTNDRDGSTYVTVFANSANRPVNVTYMYTSQNAANAALTANNWEIQQIANAPFFSTYWSGAQAVIVANNGGATNLYGTFPYNQYSQLPSFNSTGGALSGVSQIQWMQGLPIQVDYVTMRPSYLLGNNTQAWNQVGADAGYLNNTILDPLVLNLNGGAVDTTAKGENGIRFDMLGDGIFRETGWVSAGEAILVNGIQTPTSGASFMTVQQLSSLDVDHDGRVTAAEAGSLGVWQPGASGSGGNVSTLQQLGIASINLDWQALWAPQAGTFAPLGKVDHGNLISSSFTFTYVNGSTGQGADVTFGVEATDAHVQTAAQGLIQAAAGFGTLEGGGMSSIIAAMQTGSLPGLLAPTQSWQS